MKINHRKNDFIFITIFNLELVCYHQQEGEDSQGHDTAHDRKLLHSQRKQLNKLRHQQRFTDRKRKVHIMKIPHFEISNFLFQFNSNQITKLC